jgi:hypothetical protein
MIKTSLTIILMVTALFFITNNANAKRSCEKIRSDMDTTCSSLKRKCNYLHYCLVRRDTCVREGVPKSQEKCNNLARCMREHERDFNDVQRCNYKWVKPESGSGFCNVYNGALRTERHCPGRILGILYAIGYGLNSGVDSNFNCAAVNNAYRITVKDCKRYRAEYKNRCKKAEKTLSWYPVLNCKESKEFRAKIGNKYAVKSSRPTPKGKEVVNTKRNAGEEGGGNAGEEGGEGNAGEEGGGATKPK